MKKISGFLCSYLHTSGITIAALAAEIGVPESTIRHIAHRGQCPGAKTLMKLFIWMTK